MIAEVSLFFLTVFFMFVWTNKDRKLYPPGPWEIPFVGNKIVNLVKDVQKMQEKYGDIFSTRVGKYRFVYITDHKLSKEVLSRAEFSSRAQFSLMHAYEREKRENNSNGVILSNGERWQHNRRFLLRHLRDLGMGKTRMEATILFETDQIIEELRATSGEPSKIPFALNVAILNIVWSIVTGHRYGKDELDEVKKLIQHFHDTQENWQSAAVLEFFPIIKKIVPDFLQKKFLHTSCYTDGILHFDHHIQPFIDEHRKNLDPDNPKDLIDEFLIGMNQEIEDGRKESLFSEEDLRRNIWDLFIAGIDTTSTTVSFFLLYMAKHQHEQAKAHALLDQIVPKGSFAGLEHREQLVYIDAIINEVSRMCTVFPFSVNRATLEDTHINGYLITKESFVLSVTEVDHYDSRYWSHPQNFEPTRFISEEGKLVTQKDGFHPFGMGRRQCLGESVARMEIFLIAANILKKFSISSIEGQEIDTKPMDIPMFNKPNLDQKLIFTARD